MAVVAGHFPLLFVFFRVLFGDTTPPFHREIRRRGCGHAARDGNTRENEIEVASSAHEEMRDSFTLPIHFFFISTDSFAVYSTSRFGERERETNKRIFFYLDIRSYSYICAFVHDLYERRLRVGSATF